MQEQKAIRGMTQVFRHWDDPAWVWLSEEVPPYAIKIKPQPEEAQHEKD